MPHSCTIFTLVRTVISNMHVFVLHIFTQYYCQWNKSIILTPFAFVSIL